MNNRNKDALSSLLCLLFAFYVAFESYGFGLGKWHMPGPGYFPFAAASLFGFIAMVFLWQTLRQPAAEEAAVPATKRGRRNVALTLTAMIIYALLLNAMGFLLCTFFFALFFMRAIASQRWSSSLLVSLSFSLGGHLFFNVLLGAQLPGGMLALFGD